MSFRNADARRIQLYKNKGNFQTDEVRRRREDVTVELRRQKREESLAKRRNLHTTPLPRTQYADQNAESAAQAASELPQIRGLLVNKLLSDLPEDRIEAASKFRKLLSRGKNPPIQEVIDCGVVPTFVNYLRLDDQPNLQFESAWVLTNIASGSSLQTKVVIDNGGIPIFVRLLGSTSSDVKEQAIWALGNIAGDGPEFRNIVLSEGILTPLLEIFKEPNNRLSTLRNGTWTLSNLCRGKEPQPDWELISIVIPTLSRLIYSSDEEMLADTCWALSYLSDGLNDRIQRIIDANVCNRLVELLNHPSVSIQVPALRTIGNIVTGDDQQTQAVIDAGALPALVETLKTEKQSIKKEACWTISNITAGTTAQIQAVIDAGLMPIMVDILENGDMRAKKEACWAISNATSGGLSRPEQTHYIVSCGAIKPLVSLLCIPDSKIVQVALDGIDNILKVGEMERPETNGINRMAVYVDEVQGTEAIFSLQFHGVSDIYSKAFEIIDCYFKEDIPNDTTGLQDGGKDENGDSCAMEPNSVYSSVPSGGFQFAQ